MQTFENLPTETFQMVVEQSISKKEKHKSHLLPGLALFALLVSIMGSAARPAYASNPSPARIYPEPYLLPFNDFVRMLPKAEPQTLVGVYVDGVLALPVEQQPFDNPAFVTNQKNLLTQFRMASDYGSTGILAHNTLSGADFFKINLGDKIILVYGDGNTKTFQVIDTDSYRALTPRSPYSDFENLEQTEPYVGASELFKRIYMREDHLILQTCIEGSGNPSWGRLFIIAAPVDDTTSQVESIFYSWVHYIN